ncbi:MAG: succinyldiaminopimelate transaminase [Steroidobacteraceae bacterium]
MNPALQGLRAYPFERLAALKAPLRAPPELRHIPLSIGEPRHPPPETVIAALRSSLGELDNYPATRGLPELRSAAANWLTRRFRLAAGLVDPETMVLPVNGTREALFAIVQAVVDPTADPVVAMPNPLYQIYEGAALLARAEPYYLATTQENGYLPDLDAVPEDIWRRCQLLFLCSPGNPAGAVLSVEYLERALALAEKFNFIIAADECYAELYLDESSPPPSLLNAAVRMGNHALERCIVFHSLSKRSSVPGLRSGFVAGDAALMSRFLLYRTYHGCAMAVPTQRASVVAWSDDVHVTENRRLYRDKFDQVLPILQDVLDVSRPDGGFYLWPSLATWQDGDDERFTAEVFSRCNVTLLPGSYLSRATADGNPGAARVRVSLVATLADCLEAAQRLRQFLLGKAA